MEGMKRALGISVHTGWGACVLVAGTLANPEVIANEVIEILSGPDRFCFHKAAEMKRAVAERWIARARTEALANAKAALAPLLAQHADVCVIVAKDGDAMDLDEVLTSHPRIHTAEGYFYRDVLREACAIPVRIVPPKSLNPAKVGKLAVAPWGKDQKLAALAALTVMTA